MMYLRAQIRPKSVSNSFENRTSKGTEEDNRKVVFFFLFSIRATAAQFKLPNVFMGGGVWRGGELATP